jgi:putative endonuclease
MEHSFVLPVPIRELLRAISQIGKSEPSLRPKPRLLIELLARFSKNRKMAGSRRVSWMEWRVLVLERTVRWLDRVAAKRHRSSGLPAHLRTGIAGEEAAFFYVRQRGFRVVAQRWNDSPVPGDIDLIAWDGDVLCFLEVKTRTSREVATASSAVDRNKRRILRRLARHYLRHLGTGADDSPPKTRFDIVAVYELPGQHREISVIPGAFGWSEHDLESQG